MTATETGDPTADELRRRIGKLERINAALMSHVERVTDKHEGAYSLFQTAILLDGRVRRRTEELTGLMHRLEQSNRALEEARDEAEHANRSKTRFLAAASHDLLQPLHATRLSISTLADLGLEPVAARIVQRAGRGLEVIEELIRTLLDISRLDAGVVRPNRGAVALPELLGEIDADIRQGAETRGLRLVVRCAADLVAESDAALLKRIVGNLASNAVRYTGRGGVLLAARRRRGRCRIDVVDTGRGIPAAERELIFEEFFRGRAAGPGGEGLGLGLAIVRHMVSTLGHELTFRSRVDHGSWFTLLLPLGEGAEPRRSPPPVETAVRTVAFAGRRVLLVGTGASIDHARALLESWGMRVEPALHPDATGAGSAPPDLIIADHRPGEGAREAQPVAALRARFGSKVPAIVLLDRDLDAAAFGRANDCSPIHKPVKPAQLRSLISFLID